MATESTLSGLAPTCPHASRRIIETRRRKNGEFYRRWRCKDCGAQFASRGEGTLPDIPSLRSVKTPLWPYLRHRILVLYASAPTEVVMTYPELAKKFGLDETPQASAQVYNAVLTLRREGWLAHAPAGAPTALRHIVAGPFLLSELGYD